MGDVSQGQRLVGRERRAVLEMGQTASTRCACARRTARPGGNRPRSPRCRRSHRWSGPNGTNAVTPGTSGNTDLRPERGAETELGFEAGLFNRLSIDFTYYNKTTHERDREPAGRAIDRVLRQPARPTSARWINNGIELQARLQAISRRNFSWEIAGNFTTVNDVIKSNITNAITTRRAIQHRRLSDRGSLVAPRRLGRPRSDHQSADQRAVRRRSRRREAPVRGVRVGAVRLHREPDAEDDVLARQHCS